MITYNAKDLIEQAQMLADLQNSDFISWKENIMFLDNAWADLYQQIINHGDKSFLQTFKFSGSSCILPDDFYQLYYICYDDGINRRPINRKSKTSTNEGPYYDIVGNEIIIYNRLNSLRAIEVQYFPVRDSITYNAPDRKVSGIDKTIIDVSDKFVLYSDGTVASVLDSETGTTVANAVILAGNKAYTGKHFKGDNKLYDVTITDNVLTVIGHDSLRTFKTVDVNDETTISSFPAQVNAITDNGLYWVSGTDIKCFNFESGKTEVYETDVLPSKIYSFNNNLYYEKTNGIYCDGELIISYRDYDRFNGVMKADGNTGYGILVDNLVIKSAFKNTELDYPNNFYYNYMAYKLATYYKVKQGADASAIDVLAQNALKTFYDTLPRDDNEYVRIANVYAK